MHVLWVDLTIARRCVSGGMQANIGPEGKFGIKSGYVPSKKVLLLYEADFSCTTSIGRLPMTVLAVCKFPPVRPTDLQDRLGKYLRLRPASA